MADTMKVSLEIVPLRGKTTTSEHNVPVTVIGATVREIAKALKIDIAGKNVHVDGKLVTPDTVITPDQKLTVTEIRVTERPQGS